MVQSQSTPSVRNTADFSELRTYMQNTHGITVSPDVDKLHFETVRDALEGFEAVAKKFPDVSVGVKTVEIGSAGVMSCNGTKITFNPKYYTDPSVLAESIRKMTASGWWPKNTTPLSIGAHETGHAVEAVLIRISGKYQYPWERTLAWNDCTEAKTIRSEATKAIKKTPYGKGKVNAELIKSISGYANSDASETMAESFADVIANGQNANPLSLKIFEIALRMYTQYTQGGAP